MRLGVVHRKVNFCAKVDGSWAGNMFFYRKGMSPQHLSFAARAIVSVALATQGKSHIVEGPERCAFVMPMREGLAQWRVHRFTQCAHIAEASGFYTLKQIKLWTVCGLAPPVVPQLGFFQGPPSGYCVSGVWQVSHRRSTASS